MTAITTHLTSLEHAITRSSVLPTRILHHAAFHGNLPVMHCLRAHYFSIWPKLCARVHFQAKRLYCLTHVRLDEFTEETCQHQDFLKSFHCIDCIQATPLHIAVLMGHYDASKFMIHTAPNLVNIYTLSPEEASEPDATPLHIAVDNGHDLIAQLLLRNGADITATNSAGMRAIHYAQTPKMVDMLVEYGARINDPVNDDEGHSLVHFAAHFGRVSVLQHISQKYHIDLAKRASNTYEAMHCAALGSQLEVMQFLVTIGISLETTAAEEWKPIHCACQSGDVSIVDYLHKANCDLLAQDSVGWSPWHIAIAQAKLDIINYYLDEQLFTMMPVAGRLKCFEFSGMLPIHLACLSQKADVVKLLHTRRVGSLYDRDDHDRNAIHYAAVAGSLPIVNYLIQHDLSPYDTDKDGFTPLHYVQKIVIHQRSFLNDDVNAFTAEEASNYKSLIQMYTILVNTVRSLSHKIRKS